MTATSDLPLPSSINAADDNVRAGGRALSDSAALPLPHNLAIEQALIAAILRDNALIDELSDVVVSADLHHPWNAALFDLAIRQILRGSIARPETLMDMTHQWAPGVESEIAANYLKEIAASPVVLSDVRRLAGIVADHRRRRELVMFSETLRINASERLDFDVAGIIEDGEQQLYDIAGASVEARSVSLANASAQALLVARKARNRGDRLIGVTTGFRDLDEMLGGLHQSDLVILAGRPSMGKTSLATNMAFRAARRYATDAADRESDSPQDVASDGAQVLFFSMEMSAEQLATRIVAEQSRVTSTRIRRGGTTNEEFAQIVRVSREISDLPLIIDDTAALTIGQIRQRMRRTLRRSGLGLVVIDYLQLMRSGERRARDGRVMEITEITQGLKALAKEFNVPVLVLSQLSRQTEHREDHRPQLSDLRDSGSIEQDADVVLFIFRQEYYLARARPNRRERESEEEHRQRESQFNDLLKDVANIAEVDVAKHRNGPVGTVKLFFDGTLTRFDDLDDSDETDYSGPGFP